MKLRVGVGAVTVAAAARTEHHVAAVDSALVHLLQVHGAVVNLERALVAECLVARRAQHALLAARRDERAAEAGRRVPVALHRVHRLAQVLHFQVGKDRSKATALVSAAAATAVVPDAEVEHSVRGDRIGAAVGIVLRGRVAGDLNLHRRRLRKVDRLQVRYDDAARVARRQVVGARRQRHRLVADRRARTEVLAAVVVRLGLHCL